MNRLSNERLFFIPLAPLAWERGQGRGGLCVSALSSVTLTERKRDRSRLRSLDSLQSERRSSFLKRSHVRVLSSGVPTPSFVIVPLISSAAISSSGRCQSDAE